MIKRDITYEDFDGNEVTETHYFHLSKSELIEMELSGQGGSFVAEIQKVTESSDVTKILSTFRNIIAMSYGQRDPVNPSKFVKRQDITDEFMSSLAFDALFSELMTSETATVEFITGVVPRTLADTVEVRKALEEAGFLPQSMQKVGDVQTLPQTETLEEFHRRSGIGQNLPQLPRNPDERPVIVNTGPGDAIKFSARPAEETTFLNEPRDSQGALLPWAFRDPTQKELTSMTKTQLLDVMQRQSRGWVPTNPAS